MLTFTGAAVVLVLVVGWALLAAGGFPGALSGEQGGVRFYFPIMASIVLSVVLTIVLNLILWLR